MDLGTIPSFISHEAGHVVFYIVVYVLFLLLDNRLLNIHSFYGGLIPGIFVDLDHLIDYFLYKRDFVFNLKEFLTTNYFLIQNRSIILFHAWEYLLIPLGIYLFTKNSKARVIALGIFIGLFAHLLYDVWDNQLPFSFYSLVFRAHKGFSL